MTFLVTEPISTIAKHCVPFLSTRSLHSPPFKLVSPKVRWHMFQLTCRHAVNLANPLLLSRQQLNAQPTVTSRPRQCASPRSMPPGDSPRVSMHAATSQLPLIGPAKVHNKLSPLHNTCTAVLAPMSITPCTVTSCGEFNWQVFLDQRVHTLPDSAI